MTLEPADDVDDEQDEDGEDEDAGEGFVDDDLFAHDRSMPMSAPGPAHIAETSAPEIRLFGLPGAEHMHLDVASLYESEIDPWVDDPNDPEQETQQEWTVEEWDVEDPINLMPKADWFLEHLNESLCEEHVHDNDDCTWIFRAPAVLAAAEELRRVIASKVTWHQARKKLAEHKLTFDANGYPLLDGEPIYHPISLDGQAVPGEAQ